MLDLSGWFSDQSTGLSPVLSWFDSWFLHMGHKVRQLNIPFLPHIKATESLSLC